MTSRAVAAAAGLVLLAACGVDTPTERGPVSLAGGQVRQIGPQEPLGDRDVIDAESDETVRVVELHPDPDGY